MSQVNFSFPNEVLFHIFKCLPDEEIPKTLLVCKLWYDAAGQVHKDTHQKMFNRMVQVVSPAVWAAKTGFPELKDLSFEKCQCKIVRRILQIQKEEVKLNPLLFPQEKVVISDDPETFSAIQRDIRDRDLGAVISHSLNCNFQRQGFLEIGREARNILNSKNPDLILSRWPDPATNLFPETEMFENIGLTEFPSEYRLLSKIKENNLIQLSLASNYLAYLPPEIGQFPHLEFLNLNKNAFRQFPEAILQLEKLQIIGLADNPLTNIPPEISKLQKLSELNLSNTHLTSLPKECANMPNLQRIGLSGTRITSFPKEIMFCKNQALVNEMVPHLFQQLVVKLHEKNKEELYELICLLPQKYQVSIYLNCFTYKEALTSKHGRKNFFTSLSEVTLLRALIKSRLLFSSDTNESENGLTSEVRKSLKVLESSLARWTPKKFEKAREKFPLSVDQVDYSTIDPDNCLQFVYSGFKEI
jgi:hypothetical protein